MKKANLKLMMSTKLKTLGTMNSTNSTSPLVLSPIKSNIGSNNFEINLKKVQFGP